MPEAIVKKTPVSKSKAPTLVKKEGNKTVTKSPRAPRPKQAELPTMENRDIAEIEEAADIYIQKRDERCDLSKQESAAKANLIQIMKKHNRDFYSYKGLTVNVLHKDDVKVKSDKGNDEEDD